MSIIPGRGARRAIHLAAALFMGVGAVLGSGQGAAAQTYQFNSVSVQGNANVSDNTILSYAGISRGEAVSAAELNDATQAIRQAGLFRSVDVMPQGSTLVIRVDEYPIVGRIAFEGNRRIDDETLAQAVGSQTRRVYNPTQARQDTETISDLYFQRGRINATVATSIIERENNTVDLVFDIAEGGVTEIERISFVGNRSFSDRRLRGVLETKQAGLLRTIFQSDTFVADRIQLDRRMLTDFYQSRGYADFQVLNVDTSLTRERDAFLITFNVQEGQQFRIGDVGVASSVQGVDLADYRNALRLSSGSVYSPTKIEDDIARLERLAIQKGQNFLRADPQISRNDRDLTLDVTYNLVQGERIFVERIDIEGNTTTLDRVIRRQFDTVEGDPFNPRQIRAAAERIRALGYFADAEVNARQGSSEDQVVIDVNVEEQPTGSLSFGANYNTDNGVSLVASFAERNFLGRGQRLEFDISTGQSNRRFSFGFTEPAFLGRDLAFSLDASYRTTDNQNALYDTTTGRFSPGFTFPVSENGRLQLFYAYEYTDITGVDEDASQIIQNEAERGGVTTNSVGYTYSYDTRRSGLDPKSGYLLRFGQEFGTGDSDFVKTTATARAETRVWNEDVTLSATLEAGALDYDQNDSRVTDRFFLGSSRMRGFEAGGVGPRDAETDDALGGNYFAVTRLEAQFPVGLPEEYGITGGAFLDYGSVWDVGDIPTGTNVLYNDYTPRTIAGVSIFWTTPLGPLRFNFSEPVDVQERDETQNFDLTVSTNF